MSEEWIDLTDLQSVAMAQANEWEIEIDTTNKGHWYPWDKRIWFNYMSYRGRPKQPKKTIVTSECWRHPEHGGLFWRSPGNTYCKPEAYVRFPAGDVTGEIEE